jgi:hypothetical protein
MIVKYIIFLRLITINVHYLKLFEGGRRFLTYATLFIIILLNQGSEIHKRRTPTSAHSLLASFLGRINKSLHRHRIDIMISPAHCV